MLKKILILLLVWASTVNAGFSLRKYGHVKKFYSELTKKVIDIGIKHKVPPAALLAIAGLESGYGQGYVAQITGNIMSLGATKNSKQLPPLTLPHNSKKTILFKQSDIKKYEENQLTYLKRPASLKKDYRPEPFAGTNKNLEYFSKNKQQRIIAYLNNIEDFCKNWLKPNSGSKVFADTRKWLDAQYKIKGNEFLFAKNTTITFIAKIGGVKGGFNWRKSWVEKLNKILKNSGLVQICFNMHFNQLSFEKAWQGDFNEREINNSISRK